MRSWLRKMKAELVVVHTRDGQSIRGFLIDVYPQEVVLEHAAHLSPAGEIVTQGPVAIPRDNVAWYQQLQHTHGADHL